MAVAATGRQIGLIHVLAGKAGMDEDMRRDFIAREAGVRSTKELDAAAAGRVIDKLRPLAGAATSGAVAGLDTPVGGKLRALWIAGYDLGVVRDRSDRAMLAFLERQSGVSHTRFLSNPGEATAAIEALKSWLARDGKVAWPPREAWKKDGKADFDEIAESKRAVLAAQWSRLIEVGAIDKPSLEPTYIGLMHYAYRVASRGHWDQFELTDYDTVQRALGRKLRAALARSKGTKP